MNDYSLNKSEAWLIFACGEKHTYAGHNGYEDITREVYKYDSFVHNYKKIREGDLLLIRDPTELIGLAIIESIKVKEGIKERKRCPICNKTDIRFRKTKAPKYICKGGHKFDKPIQSLEHCKKFSAYFKNTFIDAKGVLEKDRLLAACPNFNQRFAMQSIDINLIKFQLLSKVPKIKNLLDNSLSQKRLCESDAHDKIYTLNPHDRRKAVVRRMKERRGQTAFRQALRKYYGDRCMITGSEIIDIIETAHISPYRGEEDNAIANGLLLRTDIHTLFDLDLLGIEPQSLTVHLNPDIRGTEYEIYQGKKLNCQAQCISLEALSSKWNKFMCQFNFNIM